MSNQIVNIETMSIKNNTKMSRFNICSNKYIKGYSIWGILLLLNALTLYFDSKCTHIIVPIEYNHISTELSNFMTQSNDYECTTKEDCNHGQCVVDKDIFNNVTGSYCECDNSYITVSNDYCTYHQLSGLAALLISIFVGGCGIDRCFISRGNGGCICLGILKGITVGGCGIWYIVDIILFGLGQINDGNGRPLYNVWEN